MDYKPEDNPGKPSIDFAADALTDCREFFALFEEVVPDVEHLMPRIRDT